MYEGASGDIGLTGTTIHFVHFAGIHRDIRAAVQVTGITATIHVTTNSNLPLRRHGGD